MARDPEGTEIDAFLKSLGATGEQIATARRESRLAGLAGDLIFAEGANLTAKDLASQAETSVDEVLLIWRTLGVDVPDDDRPMFSERDAEITRFLVQANPVGPQGLELLRVLGGSLARVAEAAVSVYVQTQDPSYDSPDLDILSWAKDQASVSRRIAEEPLKNLRDQHRAAE